VIFIISCSIYGLNNEAFLAPNPHALEILGWQDCKKIKNDWQIWRWFMPIFLHGHLEHLIGNLTGQLFMGAGIEYGIGFWSFVFVYMTTGIGGNLLSACIIPASYSVGASTAVFGLVGYLVGYLFTNWQSMGRRGIGQRVFLIVYCSVLILMNLNIGPGADPKVDNWGHLGGGITGFFCAFVVSENLDADARKKNRTPDRFTEEQYKE
jgi:rhomboid protease GluP